MLEERCGLGEGTAVVEIGPGTGQATAELLRRGAHVHAVEPGPGLARHLLAQHVGEPLEVTVSSFEDVRAPGCCSRPRRGRDVVPLGRARDRRTEGDGGASARRLGGDLVEPVLRPARPRRVQSRARSDLRGVRRCREPCLCRCPAGGALAAAAAGGGLRRSGRRALPVGGRADHGGHRRAVQHVLQHADATACRARRRCSSGSERWPTTSSAGACAGRIRPCSTPAASPAADVSRPG